MPRVKPGVDRPSSFVLALPVRHSPVFSEVCMGGVPRAVRVEHPFVDGSLLPDLPTRLSDADVPGGVVGGAGCSLLIAC